MTDCQDMNIREFIEALGSKAPTPGGGGASALCGAIGAALGAMVCNLTMGKKKFLQYESDLSRIITRAQELSDSLMRLVDADRDVFLPLAAAYSMPANTKQEQELKDAALQSALIGATNIPLDIMKAACDGIRLHEELADKCSKLAISDVGVGVIMLKSALLGASLNVYINTKLISDERLKEEFNAQADSMLKQYTDAADAVFTRVADSLK